MRKQEKKPAAASKDTDALSMSVTLRRGHIVMEFNKETRMVACTPDDAVALAEQLQRAAHAEKSRRAGIADRSAALKRRARRPGR